ncbi:MAG: hypothetical protein LBE84_10965 [Planctomycetota bacterium]|jgi:hypothetical protein|nr:hypothetical protein [Planctomycetota bacterium]
MPEQLSPLGDKILAYLGRKIEDIEKDIRYLSARKEMLETATREIADIIERTPAVEEAAVEEIREKC